MVGRSPEIYCFKTKRRSFPLKYKLQALRSRRTFHSQPVPSMPVSNLENEHSDDENLGKNNQSQNKNDRRGRGRGRGRGSVEVRSSCGVSGSDSVRESGRGTRRGRERGRSRGRGRGEVFNCIISDWNSLVFVCDKNMIPF
ncbi:hypothetical protein BpHYR1_006091 [Brachionus plicatilis]|uniref:Uncharacterized protein n=1 Tax=Brachionus plicatilis TaxID=10195 RepID=A0A3M7SG25_BRAPC|nr:hypothetical protein BpHYR1_006091 [Brachionus plicatilis]